MAEAQNAAEKSYPSWEAEVNDLVKPAIEAYNAASEKVEKIGYGCGYSEAREAIEQLNDTAAAVWAWVRKKCRENGFGRVNTTGMSGIQKAVSSIGNAVFSVTDAVSGLVQSDDVNFMNRFAVDCTNAAWDNGRKVFDKEAMPLIWTSMAPMYRLQRNKELLTSSYCNTSTYQKIDLAFRGYTEVCREFPNDRDIRKFPTGELNRTEAIMYAMGVLRRIVKDHGQGLEEFIHIGIDDSGTKLKPYAVSCAAAVDHGTRCYRDVFERKDDVKKLNDSVTKVLELYKTAAQELTEDISSRLLAAETRYLNTLLSLTRQALKEYDAYDTLTGEAPYCFLSFPNSLKRAVSETNLLDSLPDPRRDGTCYYDCFKVMRKKLYALARDAAL